MLMAQGMELFAQHFFSGPGGRGPSAPSFLPGPQTQTAIIAVCVFVAIGGTIIEVLFVLCTRKCLREIHPRHRDIAPGRVWLCLIPLFGYVWKYVVVSKLAESLHKEYRSRDWPRPGDGGQLNGLVYLTGQFLCGIVSLVFFVFYWLQISGYTEELRQNSGGRKR